jgi:hypothetical protein
MLWFITADYEDGYHLFRVFDYDENYQESEQETRHTQYVADQMDKHGNVTFYDVHVENADSVLALDLTD